MAQRRKLITALVGIASVVGVQVVWTNAQAVAEPRNPGIVRLQTDATAGLTLERNVAGMIDFVGTTAGNEVVNPAVSVDSAVSSAARAHLDRYGAALGLASDDGLSIIASMRSTSGQDVVRFQQEVDSVPVIGGQVVVSLRSDRQLSSLLSTISTMRSLPVATVSESTARATALRGARRASSATQLDATSEGRWVFDPAIFGQTDGLAAQGVWRFEVSDGVGVRRLVLVDDTSGRVLLDIDQIQHADRVVCDRANAPGAQTACTSGFDRIETGPASGVADVNDAFVHAGEVSDFYQQIGGIDLTQKLGVLVGGVKKLAATVRYCPPSGDGVCPYENAFWNGTQMFYGDTYAGADDVVGHEMTHGVIDQYSELFYWGQSGAMNESIADIMGEIVDHRAGLVGADSDWRLGEDLPIGAIRDMKNPPADGDPDKMTSTLYKSDSVFYSDAGGVHTNSGVGNKTAYLISQGGTFNGQTITGIDGADAGLTKTAKLYFEAITKLTSGSDYANLAAVLEQGCADLVTSGTAGFTAADCTNLAKAVLATELRTTPTNAPQPADAVKACPTGTTMRELFNSETGAAASKFTVSAAGTWGYGVNSDWGSNATSGRDSWFGPNLSADLGVSSASLTATAGVALPAGQQSYLSFQQWRLFEWYVGAPPRYIDGGTVEIDPGTGAVDAAALPWTNGPTQTLVAYGASYPNEWAGRKAFGGDSFGWISSQLSLASYAGQTIKPQFTLRSDDSGSLIGWWLDDIVVYTCDPAVTPTPTPVPTPIPVPTPTPTPVPTPLVSSKTTLKFTSGKVAKIIAKVKAGGSAATGKVTFKVDGKVFTKTVKLKKGKAVFKLSQKKLAKLGKGKHKVKVSYSGSETAKASKAKKTFKLK